MTIDYELGEDLVAKSRELSHHLLEEVVEVLVKSKESYIDITIEVTLPAADIEVEVAPVAATTETTVTEEGESPVVVDTPVVSDSQSTGVVPEAPHTRYSARLFLNELPAEGEMRWELEGKNIGNEVLTSHIPMFHVKTLYDDFKLLTIHKLKELEEAQAAFEEAAAKVKEAKKANAANTAAANAQASTSASPASKKTVKEGKKSKKSRKSTGPIDIDADPVVDTVQSTSAAEVPSEPKMSWSEYAMATGTAALMGAINHRAVILFGVAVFGIAQYGDYASV